MPAEHYETATAAPGETRPTPDEVKRVKRYLCEQGGHSLAPLDMACSRITCPLCGTTWETTEVES